MSQQDPEFWNKVRRAHDKLVKKYLDHPDVTLIDMGSPPEQATVSEEIVLRVHVRTRWAQTDPRERTQFPSEIDGIPVVVIPGDYDFSDNSLSVNGI